MNARRHHLLTPQRRRIQDSDDSSSIPFVALAQINNRIHAFHLYPNNSYRVIDSESEAHNLFIPKVETITSDEIIEFEELVNSERTEEKHLQQFLEQNSKLILEDKYQMALPQVILQNTGSARLIPDFILDSSTDNMSDILEIKLPKSKIIVGHKYRRRFSSSIHEGIAQLKKYSSFFDDYDNRELIKARFGVELYKPKLILVIGRSNPNDVMNLRSLKSELSHNIEIRTYDDILKVAKRLAQV